MRRAQKLFGTPKFKSEIGRKIRGALLLREMIENSKGQIRCDAYSGASMAIRCGDGNPRRLIRIFKTMLLAADRTGGFDDAQTKYYVDPTVQTEKLILVSEQVLKGVTSEMDCSGLDLYKLLKRIGVHMQDCFYKKGLNTDQVTSLTVTERDSDYWPLIKRAVGLGLLYPNVNPNNPDAVPVSEGTFHLAYALAPHFRLLPRRGSSISLKTILESTIADSDAQLILEFGDSI